MRWMMLALLLAISPRVAGQAAEPVAALDVRLRPAGIEAGDLVEFESQADGRRHLIKVALAVARDSPGLPYLAGGADPKEGGYDCSEAMYFVMRKAGFDAPRSSAGQMEWLRKAGRLHQVPSEAAETKHASFAALKPGDLLFWAVDDDHGESRVHHVAMYPGNEKRDGLPVMVGSSVVRSYRGKKSNGYDVKDFRIPTPESHSKLVGYGTPPGIGVE